MMEPRDQTGLRDITTPSSLPFRDFWVRVSAVSLCFGYQKTKTATSLYGQLSLAFLLVRMAVASYLRQKPQ